MISEEKVEEALDLLIDTEETASEAKADVTYYENQLRHVRSKLYLNSKEKTVVAKECDALSSDEYMEAVNIHRDAIVKYEIIRNQRFTAQQLIDVWRSFNANRRQGGV